MHKIEIAIKKYERVLTLSSSDGPGNATSFDGLEGLLHSILDLNFGASLQGRDCL